MEKYQIRPLFKATYLDKKIGRLFDSKIQMLLIRVYTIFFLLKLNFCLMLMPNWTIINIYMDFQIQKLFLNSVSIMGIRIFISIYLIPIKILD